MAKLMKSSSGTYRVVKLIGAGAEGEAYLVEDQDGKDWVREEEAFGKTEQLIICEALHRPEALLEFQLVHLQT